MSGPFRRHGREVFVVSAVRTPIGRGHPEKGVFATTHPNELLGATFQALFDRTGSPPGDIEDIVIGCTSQIGAQSRNIARNAWLQMGYPSAVPATTIDRRCGSAQTAIAMGSAQVASGMHDLVIAGGVEHMGMVPIDAVRTTEAQFGSPWPPSLRERYDFVPQGESAELIADKWDIDRREMDEFAVRSHRLASEAAAAGRFQNEIVPINTDAGLVDQDQGIRPNTDLAKLSNLPAAFRPDGRITAGTSSQISDGAATVLLASAEATERLGVRPLARIVDHVSVGVDPILMLTGPIPATELLLERNGMKIGDIDLIEINEAFAPVVLAWERELKPDMDRVNVNGGAIALGHPVGATGARLLTTLLYELERRGSGLGLVTMCCGGGLGTGTIVERIDP